MFIQRFEMNAFFSDEGEGSLARARSPTLCVDLGDKVGAKVLLRRSEVGSAKMKMGRMRGVHDDGKVRARWANWTISAYLPPRCRSSSG